MKKVIIALVFLFIGFCCKAQATLAFPFQGGKEIMYRFFKENIVISPDITERRATGLVIFKFTADQQGAIRKIIIYYADDASLVGPLAEALKKSDRKWIIPDHEKVHDFILPFSVRFYINDKNEPETQKTMYDFLRTRRPIQATDQIPLDEVSLLPVVEVPYQ
jgi:hypothetical protein